MSEVVNLKPHAENRDHGMELLDLSHATDSLKRMNDAELEIFASKVSAEEAIQLDRLVKALAKRQEEPPEETELAA